MNKPLIARTEDTIVISFNGRKVIKPIKDYKNMTDDEIAIKYIGARNIKNNRS